VSYHRFGDASAGQVAAQQVQSPDQQKQRPEVVVADSLQSGVACLCNFLTVQTVFAWCVCAALETRCRQS
jgi:hypothetical protein